MPRKRKKSLCSVPFNEGERYHFHEEVVPALAIPKLTVQKMAGKERRISGAEASEAGGFR